MTSISAHHDKAKIGVDRETALRLKNNRLGMTIFQASWIMVFIAMIVVNWQLRFSYAQWPPAGVAPYDPLLPSLATLALLQSAILVRRGWQSLRRDHLEGFRLNWRLAMALGLAFMAIIVYEFATVSAAALATQYGVTLRLMTGFHVVQRGAGRVPWPFWRSCCASIGARRGALTLAANIRAGRWKAQPSSGISWPRLG